MQKLIGCAHHKFLNSLVGIAMKKVSAQIGTYHNAYGERKIALEFSHDCKKIFSKYLMKTVKSFL